MYFKMLSLTIAVVMTVTGVDSDVCITSCLGLSPGHYQSCRGCSVYATCYRGVMFDNRPCPLNGVWDDKDKTCRNTSTTCNSAGTLSPQVGDQTSTTPGGGNGAVPKSCVTSCLGLAPGHYQSCQGCSVYASCHGGVLYDNRPCPVNGVWDDNDKTCRNTSTTCNAVVTSSPGVGDQTSTAVGDQTSTQVGDQTSTTPGGGNGTTNCATNCAGLEDGDFQSCRGCSVYATCFHDIFYDNQPCPVNRVWDDNEKSCQYTSTTCDSK